MAPSNDDEPIDRDDDPPASSTGPKEGRARAPRHDDERTSAQDPKRELSQLWQQALGSIDEIRDAIVRGSHAGRAKLDAQLLIRQRDKLLMQIGRQLLDDVANGHPMPPGCDELARRVDELDADIETAEQEARKVLKR